ncbi:hypothetical protein D3C81_1614390 [compost metagenome]
MVTTSTANWVSARSGAAKRAKASATSRPATLRMTSATRRWRWNQAVSGPLSASRTRPSAVMPSSSLSGRSPYSLGSGAMPANTTTAEASSRSIT